MQRQSAAVSQHREGIVLAAALAGALDECGRCQLDLRRPSARCLQQVVLRCATAPLGRLSLADTDDNGSLESWASVRVMLGSLLRIPCRQLAWWRSGHAASFAPQGPSNRLYPFHRRKMSRSIIFPPRSITRRTFLSQGATGWIYKVEEGIVLKYPLTGNNDLAKENTAYDIFEAHHPCPFVIQSFLRLPNAIFLPLFSGGNLQKRLESNQLRGPRNSFLAVLRLEPIPLVERWAMELSGAVAWLESLGLVHGDLRPENLLLDGEDHLKLTDFDCVKEIGTDASGNSPPWARLLGPEAGDRTGTWGVNGPQTEQFAVGSLLYCMAHGCEPFQKEALEQDLDIVRLLKHMEFPELGHGLLDGIIYQCWRGRYASLELLAKETAGLPGAIELPRATILGSSYIAEQRKRCQRLVGEGLVGETK
ncbi:Serine/threonine-protein kinase Sgk1 [Tolypocladium paradoxum]|uniref:EKC/KEOPS complex subunit BUD32 n=1 Tax=Tolypocladium paradoxum TaxID=94208 RepID=A0A2S4KWF8_9HYPO|nr:Serine/threonine-protein kinase Sgk1 [Tolypocladium paradoxum]